ncbi:unnamed protein product [Auanema sp. JU1783]|nr:unnamed protein product [Auanema sp. JU1783]
MRPRGRKDYHPQCFLNTANLISPFPSNRNGYSQYNEERITEHKKDIALHENLDCFKIKCFIYQGDVSLKVEITNIRIEGIHNFEMKNFDRTDTNEDLVLDVDGEKLHCHSQVLSWNSEIFRTMIKERNLFEGFYSSQGSSRASSLSLLTL